MPKREDIKSILVIGSGPIVIGQACEFDYSGTQAVKALKEEGYRVVLVNSNPATIMTDPVFADATYIEPITCEFVTKIIEKERPDVLLPTIGGQTALNTAIELDEAGVLEKYNVELIGASVEAIKKAEDRERFKDVVAECGLESARSYLVHDMETALKAADKLGFPLIIRPSRTLGGSGGAIVEKREDLEDSLSWGFEQSPINELLIEESLLGWKELELEVMRDRTDNAVVICAIENLDPMGLHTGDSITVAPIQTLTDKEYQNLRDSALSLMRAIGVDTGGSNVQFAICPTTGRQIVIEMNPRVSRSSALASKATGFPIAKIAAKLAVGYSLDELPNDITKETPASFEPSIDYVVVKIPRFTFEKFEGADSTLGTQMKSVGEAMAMGRTFPEALQKACRSLELDRTGLLGGPEESESNLEELLEKTKRLNPIRMFQIARAMELGASVEEVYEITSYDPWFTREFEKIIQVEKELREAKLENLSVDLLRRAKRLGQSDQRVASLLDTTEASIREKRLSWSIKPAYKTVDTCAAEFASKTPYLYSTYEEESDSISEDGNKVAILGGGPNRIGQGLEFDYCCVHAAFALRDAGIQSVMINCNPETVSTDYDTSDKLYFEPLTLEDVLEILDREKPNGVIVQYGGQTPLKLAQALKDRGIPIVGTSPESIDMTEDREKFKALLDKLGLKQSANGLATNEAEALKVAEEVGYPLIVRPSFVLGGRAMVFIHNPEELKKYIKESVSVSHERPVLLDRFLEDAIEIDVDAVSDGEDVLVCGICEHIERAGIHSGDSSFILPSQTLSDILIKEIEEATRALAKNCEVRGLMNVQYAIAKGQLYVIEVNPRASRSVPFVSKVVGIPWAKVGARVMAGESLAELQLKGDYGNILVYRNYLEAISRVNYVSVKESVFPFAKFRGVDTQLGPEMRSTGEVMGLDRTLAGGFNKAQKATGLELPLKGEVFLSLKDSDKQAALGLSKKLDEMGFKLVATEGTTRFLKENGIEAEQVNKVMEGSPHILDAFHQGRINLVINTPEGTGPLLDSTSIRSTATALSLPLFTTIAAAEAAVDSIEQANKGMQLGVDPIQNYIATIED